MPLRGSQLSRGCGTPDAPRLTRSLKSALRTGESGFAKIGQSWVPVFVDEDHAKTTILEQNRIRNYPDRT